MHSNYWLLLLFLLAVAIGWFLGRMQRRRGLHSTPAKLTRHYFTGLNYLLNEQTDKAIDLFVRLLNVDQDTVEIHLILGNLFRRRGEVDRAIRLHQNLIARPNLNQNLRVQAILALGCDYMAAGMYDRAERLFLEAVDVGNRQQNRVAMYSLLKIYEKEKDWEKAIEYAEQLTNVNNKADLKVALAHYYTEQLEKNIQQLSPVQINQALGSILQHNPHHVRASIFEGDYLQQQRQWKAALQAYQRIVTQDIRYIPYAISAIVACFKELGDREGLLDYLEESFTAYPNITTLIHLIEQWQLVESKQNVAELLAAKLRQQPFIQGLHYLIGLLIDAQKDESAKALILVQELLKQAFQQSDHFQCRHCGFKSKDLLWLCPGCQHWNTVIPLTGLEYIRNRS